MFALRALTLSPDMRDSARQNPNSHILVGTHTHTHTNTIQEVALYERTRAVTAHTTVVWLDGARGGGVGAIGCGQTLRGCPKLLSRAARDSHAGYKTLRVCA